jgi:hypothetical protein
MRFASVSSPLDADSDSRIAHRVGASASTKIMRAGVVEHRIEPS